MSIDFSSLGQAISRLEKSLGYVHSPLAQSDPGLQEQFRNSVIQCFEFTYQLTHKMLRRYLEETADSPEEIDLLTFSNMIRIANEKGLLRSDWKKWRTYRQARTDSSHTYDEDKAEAVFAVAPDFLEEARYLFQTLTERSKKC